MNRLLPKSTIDARKKRRRPVDITTSVKLPRSLDLALKREAKAQQRSQSWIMREAIQAYLSFREANNSTTQQQFEAERTRST